MKSLNVLAAALVLALPAGHAQAANVLVILSDSDHLDLRDDRVFPTGFYLNELMQPVKRFIDAGHQVTFATPSGLAPTVDRGSLDPMYFGGDAGALKVHQELLDRLALTRPTHSPVLSLARVEQIGYGQFDAVYVPGGHAPMQDLLSDPALGRLLADFHRRGKITALVCHGPIALLSTLPANPAFIAALVDGKTPQPPSGWIYAGYRLTVISNQEEELAKGALQGGRMKFYPQTALEAAGAHHVGNATPWAANVVIDRELITGQNPASANDVAEAMLERLD